MSSDVAEPSVAGVTYRYAEVNGVRLHIAEAGDGPPVVLLHGFPEFWYSWRHQLPALAAAGFHAVAPDLRGFNRSDKPPRIADYRGRELVADIAELIQRDLGGSAFVVGHDWGGIVAWRLAQTHPALVRKLVILNAAFPAAYLREFRRNPGQWLRSWYVMFFQLPRVPEMLFRSRDFRSLEETMRKYPRAFSPEDIAHYKHAIARPGALTAGINYYRAVFRYVGDFRDPPQDVTMPTLVLWGKRDPYATPRVLDGLDRWIRDLRLVTLPEIGHWTQNDASDEVNRQLLEFLRE